MELVRLMTELLRDDTLQPSVEVIEDEETKELTLSFRNFAETPGDFDGLLPIEFAPFQHGLH
jgi:hypothetical protein